MSKARILVVEDEAIIAADLSDRLGRMGYAVAAMVPSGAQALETLAGSSVDLVLMDIFLQDAMTGIEAAEAIRARHGTPVVYVTSHADTPTLERAALTGPFGYVLKPFSERELQVAIEIALYRHKAESRLRNMERWLTTALQNVAEAVVATDRDGTVLLLNREAERLTGWEERDARGRPLAEVLRVLDGQTKQPVPDLVQQAVREGLSIRLAEHICVHAKTGTQVPIDDSVAPIRDDSGAITGAVVAFHDCTPRRHTEDAMKELTFQLEGLLRERTAELEIERERSAHLQSANIELEAFSRSVSHDLQAPLRAVNGYSHLLMANYTGVLDDEGRGFLGVIMRNSRQLAQTIDDFLRLVRLRNEALRVSSIDMTRLAAEVAAEATRQGDATNPIPVFHIQQLPPARGDPALIRQVWVNLLGNAVKFSRQRAQPSIDVGTRVESGETVYYVRDNGVGFDPADADKLFIAFARLPGSEEYEGIGIGLATVARIMQRHGGRVRAEGAINGGASFYFSFPPEQGQAEDAEPPDPADDEEP
jgi:two-component system cell cycle sensor histidine kinase/response regulator CckA